MDFLKPKSIPSCKGVEFLMSVRSVLQIKSGSIVFELVFTCMYLK